MRRLELRSKFRHDLKREDKGIYSSLLGKGGELNQVVSSLVNNIPLAPKYRDHMLHGEWEGSRECHVKPDFLLVYTYVDDDILRLERLGSHAELFGM